MALVTGMGLSHARLDNKHYSTQIWMSASNAVFTMVWHGAGMGDDSVFK